MRSAVVAYYDAVCNYKTEPGEEDVLLDALSDSEPLAVAEGSGGTRTCALSFRMSTFLVNPAVPLVQGLMGLTPRKYFAQVAAQGRQKPGNNAIIVA